MTYPEFVESLASDASKATYQARLTTAALGLAGEAGELADEIKKHFFHGHELTREKVIKELGDITWYITFLMNTMNTTMEEVQAQNIKKLQIRYKSGKFTAAESRSRNVDDT